MKKILIAHDLKPQLVASMNFLHRADIAVLTAMTNEDLLKLHIEEHVDLIITRADLPAMALETVLHVFRRSATMQDVSVILICENASLQQEQSSRYGVNAVLTRPVDPVALAKKVHELLSIAPRRSYRVVLNMNIEGKNNGRPLLCSTENVSTHGMLIRTTERLAAGDRISCSFYLPDGTRVSAAGEVARVAAPAAPSDQNRYGIRFASLVPAMETALAAFVDKERHKQAGAEKLVA